MPDESVQTIDIPESLVEKLHGFLGEDGLSFFRECQTDHGTVSPVLTVKLDGGRAFPHPVHFREGMQVRNAMRGFDECESWDDHDLDNHWQKVVEQALLLDVKKGE